MDSIEITRSGMLIWRRDALIAAAASVNSLSLSLSRFHVKRRVRRADVLSKAEIVHIARVSEGELFLFLSTLLLQTLADARDTFAKLAKRPRRTTRTLE